MSEDKQEVLEIKTCKLLEKVKYLVEQVEEDVPRDYGTRHLWSAVDDVKNTIKATRHEPVFVAPPFGDKNDPLI